LLLAGNTAAYRDRVATILIERLAPVITAIENAGGQINERPSTPNGGRLNARHPGRVLKRARYIDDEVHDEFTPLRRTYSLAADRGVWVSGPLAAQRDLVGFGDGVGLDSS
jgi:hypothetical protein